MGQKGGQFTSKYPKRHSNDKPSGPFLYRSDILLGSTQKYRKDPDGRLNLLLQPHKRRKKKRLFLRPWRVSKAKRPKRAFSGQKRLTEPPIIARWR